MSQPLSNKVHLYVEKIITKMNLDEAQQNTVRAEFLDHIQEAVSHALSVGCCQSDAEAKAMQDFGEHSILAKQFGFTGNMAWRLFECLAIFLSTGVFIYFSFPYMTAFWGWSLQTQFIILSTYITLIITYAIPGNLYLYWTDIQVNGKIQIRRIFRKQVLIEFNQIQKVCLVKGYWFRFHQIRLHYNDGQIIRLHSRMRNMRCTAMALSALVPEVLEDKVAHFFKSRVLKLRKERPWMRPVSAIGYIIALAMIAYDFSYIWDYVGISFCLLMVMIILSSCSGFQRCYHQTDRARNALTLLFSAALLVFCFYLVSATWVGNVWIIRYTLISIIFIILFLLLMLFWHGKRSSLLGIALFCLLAIISIKPLIPHMNNYNAKVVGTFPEAYMTGSAWIGPDQSTFIAIGDLLRTKEDDGVLLISQNGKSELSELGEGQWGLLPQFDSDYTLVYEAPFGEENMRKQPCRIYKLDSSLKMELLATTPAETWKSYFMNYNLPFWSPERDWIIIPIPRTDEKRVMPKDFKLVNLRTGNETVFEDLLSLRLWWNEENQLMSITRPQNWLDEKGKQKPGGLHKLWKINPESGEQTLVKSFELPEEYFAHRIPMYPLLEIKSKSHEWVYWDLERNAFRKDLKGLNRLNWLPVNGRMVFWDKNKSKIIVRNNEEVFYEHKLSSKESVWGAQISPDGKRFFYLSMKSGTIIPIGFLQIHVVDMLTSEVQVVKVYPMFLQKLMMLYASDYISVTDICQWQQDSLHLTVQSIKLTKNKSSFITNIKSVINNFGEPELEESDDTLYETVFTQLEI